jgi:hypothetical protein
MITVVLLRDGNFWRSRIAVLGPPHHVGQLIYCKADAQHWGPSYQARLVDPRRPDRDLIPPLQYAKIVEAREGGQFIRGTEYHFRAVKSKAVKKKQVWWCMFGLERALIALARMDARSSSGFHPNDDDDAGLDADSWPD